MGEQEKPTTTFRLLMKKGNKQTTYNLEIPSESPFANRKHDDEWEEEQRAIKRKVLEYEAQEAEEEILNAGGDAIPYDIGRFRDPTKMKPKMFIGQINKFSCFMYLSDRCDTTLLFIGVISFFIMKTFIIRLLKCTNFPVLD